MYKLMKKQKKIICVWQHSKYYKKGYMKGSFNEICFWLHNIFLVLGSILIYRYPLYTSRNRYFQIQDEVWLYFSKFKKPYFVRVDV